MVNRLQTLLSFFFFCVFGRFPQVITRRLITAAHKPQQWAGNRSNGCRLRCWILMCSQRSHLSHSTGCHYCTDPPPAAASQQILSKISILHWWTNYLVYVFQIFIFFCESLVKFRRVDIKGAAAVCSFGEEIQTQRLKYSFISRRKI